MPPLSSGALSFTTGPSEPEERTLPPQRSEAGHAAALAPRRLAVVERRAGVARLVPVPG